MVWPCWYHQMPYLLLEPTPFEALIPDATGVGGLSQCIGVPPTRSHEGCQAGTLATDNPYCRHPALVFFLDLFFFAAPLASLLEHFSGYVCIVAC